MLYNNIKEGTKSTPALKIIIVNNMSDKVKGLQKNQQYLYRW